MLLRLLLARVSTYPQIAKIACVILYVIALVLFFALIGEPSPSRPSSARTVAPSSWAPAMTIRRSPQVTEDGQFPAGAGEAESPTTVRLSAEDCAEAASSPDGAFRVIQRKREEVREQGGSTRNVRIEIGK
jgi:hypothetical protein